MNDENATPPDLPPNAASSEATSKAPELALPLHKRMALQSIARMTEKAEEILPADFLDDLPDGRPDLDRLTTLLTTQALTLDTTFYHILRICDDRYEGKPTYQLALRVQDQFLRVLRLLYGVTPPPPPVSSPSSSPASLLDS